MKRFKIKNNKNGMEFMIEREELGELQPEWGKPERWLTEAELMLEGHQKTDAVESQVEKTEVGDVTMYKLPAEFTIGEESMDMEIAAKNAKDQARLAKLNSIKPLKGKSLSDAEMKQVCEFMLEALFDENSSLAAELVRLAAALKKP